MPSAQKVEIHEPQRPQAEPDLHSLLRDVHAPNGNHNVLHGRDKVLFAEGEPARGAHILRTGSATVSISSSEGRVVILRLARAGEVLGLNAVLQNSSYEATVKTLEPCRTDFISRAELIEMIQKSDAAKHTALKILSGELAELTSRTRSLLLPQTASARLARLLLDWCYKTDGNNSHVIRLDKLFTHEQMAQMIGSSRETVTRLLATFSKRDVIYITADSILIKDRDRLEQMAM